MKFNMYTVSPPYQHPRGSSLLALMQNESYPVLDLLVRESIQNSLDASASDKDVIVDFNIGEFNNYDFASFFEGIEDNLKKIGDTKQEYIAIRDRNTIGLIGNKDGQYEDEANQNLGKLVYQIMENQTKEGSGGSWGIGKTVYFRIGNGLVLYYSRIKLENNKYEERIVAALIVDEEKDDNLLNFTKNNCGTAFFGKNKVENGKELSEVITDEIMIAQLLAVLNIPRFKGDQTGTTVVIPYIKQNKLLDNNNICEGKLFYTIDIERFIKTSILRWYFRRMNKNYSYGAKLLATVNGEEVKLSGNYAIFEELNNMYSDYFLKDNDEYNSKEIIWNRKNKILKLGTFIYKKLNEKNLNIEDGNFNCDRPYKYVNISDDFKDGNLPIVCYTRKPGMINNYTTDNKWVGSLKTEIDEYIIGIFVLNSNFDLYYSSNNRDKSMKLEEYVRKAEKSDHFEWEDKQIADADGAIRLIHQIKQNVKNTIYEKFSPPKEDIEYVDSKRAMGKYYADLFLPNHKFGHDSSTKGVGLGGGISVSSSSKGKITQKNNIAFVKGGVRVSFEIRAKSGCKSVKIEAKVKTSAKTYTMKEWVDNGFQNLYCLNDIVYKVNKYDGENIIVDGKASKDCKIQETELSIEFNKLVNGEVDSITIRNNDEKDFVMLFSINVAVRDKNMQLVLATDFNGGK